MEGGLQQALLPGANPDPRARQAPLQLRSLLLAHHARHLRPEAPGLFLQEIQVAVGGKGDHAQAVAVGLHDLQGLGAYGARGPQHRQPSRILRLFHRNIIKVIGALHLRRLHLLHRAASDVREGRRGRRASRLRPL
jgi:hypothetical protein